MEKDKNYQTERIYKAGYKLSEISNQLKISEIKSVFEIKKTVREAQKDADNLKEFRENVQQKGFSVMIRYTREFKANRKNEIQDIWINKVDSSQEKNGFFFRKNVGFSLSAIDSDLGNLVKLLNQGSINNDVSNHSKSETNESLIEIAGGLLGEFLNPTYASQDEDELWKKKRKLRR